MRALNYCKSAIGQFEKSENVPLSDLSKGLKSELLIGIMAEAKKFILPNDGNIIESNYYSALDPEKVLRLPYDVVALEYESTPASVGEFGLDLKTMDAIGASNSGRIIVAYESPTLKTISLTCVYQLRVIGQWFATPICLIPTTGYLTGVVKDGFPQIKLLISAKEGTIKQCDAALMNRPIRVFFNFINYLQCSNIKIEKLPPVKTKNDKKKKSKNVKKFDTYHILTVRNHDHIRKIAGKDVVGRSSPRQHLRRGHIRRLQDGRKIWVNAAIISSKNTNIVQKDYRIK